MKNLTMNAHAIGQPCPKCKRIITAEIVELIRKIRSDNIRATVRKVKERGTIRKSKVDWDRVARLHYMGHSNTDIAIAVGCGQSTISVGLTKRRIRI